MSRYGYLRCHDCQVAVWLGKAIFVDGRPSSFHIGQPDDPPNSQNQTLTRVVWKFLADHAGHDIAVLVEGQPGYARLADYQEIGGDTDRDISFDDYLRGFTG